MSGEIRQLSFVVTTSDPQHWQPEQVKQFGDGDPDVVIDKLCEVMREAGNMFVAAYPEVFHVEVM
jgi:hypothetical protein